MDGQADVPRIAMQVSRGVVVASIQVDLDDGVLEAFRADLLARIQDTGSLGVILDVSGLELLDPEELAALRRVITMAGLMGARTVLAGLRPGVVSALVGAGAEVTGLEAAIDLDAAFELLLAQSEGPPQEGGEPDPDHDSAGTPAEDAPFEPDAAHDELPEPAA